MVRSRSSPHLLHCFMEECIGRTENKFDFAQALGRAPETTGCYAQGFHHVRRAAFELMLRLPCLATRTPPAVTKAVAVEMLKYHWRSRRAAGVNETGLTRNDSASASRPVPLSPAPDAKRLSGERNRQMGAAARMASAKPNDLFDCSPSSAKP